MCSVLKWKRTNPRANTACTYRTVRVLWYVLRVLRTVRVLVGRRMGNPMQPYRPSFHDQAHPYVAIHDTGRVLRVSGRCSTHARTSSHSAAGGLTREEITSLLDRKTCTRVRSSHHNDEATVCWPSLLRTHPPFWYTCACWRCSTVPGVPSSSSTRRGWHDSGQ